MADLPVFTRLVQVPSTRSFRERSREGYLLVDHTASPGMAKDLAGLSTGEGTKVELPTVRCGHCPSAYVINPWRQRERGHCFKCHHRLCDECAIAYKINKICRPWVQVVDDVKSGKTETPVLARSLGPGI